MSHEPHSQRAGRVRRPLTPEEQTRLAQTRATLDREEQTEIRAIARRFRDASRVANPIPIDGALRALAEARQSQGVTLQEMTERTGIAKGNLSRLENDPEANPTVATLVALADALGKRIAIVLVDK